MECYNNNVDISRKKSQINAMTIKNNISNSNNQKFSKQNITTECSSRLLTL